MVTERGWARVKGLRAPIVRERLKAVRAALGWSLRQTALAVNNEASGADKPLQHVYVTRYEGSSREKRSLPYAPLAYVRAFAVASWRSSQAKCEALLAEAASPPDWNDEPPKEQWIKWLLAEDALAFDPNATRRRLDRIEERYQDQWPPPPRSEDELARDRLRDAVAWTLLCSVGIPDPQDFSLGRDPVAWFVDDLVRLFWEAFWDRGLDVPKILDAAWEFGQRIPIPNRLSSVGFRALHELEPFEFKRWWMLQSESLRCVARGRSDGSKFRAEDMNLGHFGEAGWSFRWAEWMDRWTECDRGDALRVAKDVVEGASQERTGGSYVRPDRIPGRVTRTFRAASEGSNPSIPDEPQPPDHGIEGNDYG